MLPRRTGTRGPLRPPAQVLAAVRRTTASVAASEPVPLLRDDEVPTGVELDRSVRPATAGPGPTSTWRVASPGFSWSDSVDPASRAMAVWRSA